MNPNFFLIGAPKCGTSALSRYLSEHPRIFFSTPKETVFWCSDMPGLRDELGHHRKLPDYLALFEKADPEQHLAAGEGSTIYFLSSDAATNILEFNPDARFIVMLRDPVDMVHALHMQRRNDLREDLDFEAAWLAQEDRASGRRPLPRGCPEPMLLQYRAAASYGRQLERLFGNVPREKVLVLFYDELRSDPADVYERALAHLDVPSDGRTDFGRVNPAHTRRFPMLNKMVLNPPGPLRPIVFRIRKHFQDRRYPAIERFKKSLKKPAKRSPMPPEMRERIIAEFKEDTERLEAVLGRPAPWAQRS